MTSHTIFATQFVGVKQRTLLKSTNRYSGEQRLRIAATQISVLQTVNGHSHVVLH
jgi:hypothetical protein